MICTVTRRKKKVIIKISEVIFWSNIKKRDFRTVISNALQKSSEDAEIRAKFNSGHIFTQRSNCQVQEHVELLEKK